MSNHVLSIDKIVGQIVCLFLVPLDPEMCYILAEYQEMLNEEYSHHCRI